MDAFTCSYIVSRLDVKKNVEGNRTSVVGRHSDDEDEDGGLFL